MSTRGAIKLSAIVKFVWQIPTVKKEKLSQIELEYLAVNLMQLFMII